MGIRRTIVVCAALGTLTLAGCGDDLKDAAGKASGAVSDAKAAADTVAELSKVDKKFAAKPEDVVKAARASCAFIETHSDKGKQAEEVRQRFDKIGVTNIEAAQAKTILSILKSQVCPRLK